MEKNRLRVLLADDERLARETMRDYLPWEKMGMEVPVCVENGELALDYLCTHPVDIFIMDIRMPVMDGMKLLEEIGRRNLEILIIVLSAYDQFEYARKAIQSRRVFEYVLMPIKRKDFCRILEKAASEITRTRGMRREEDLAPRLNRLYQEYMACVRHYQTDDALALLKAGLEGEAGLEIPENLEMLRQFLVFLYTEMQLMVLQQPSAVLAGRGAHEKAYMDGLRLIGSSTASGNLLEHFTQAVRALVPYLEPGSRENVSKTSAVIRHCLEEIQKHYTERDFSLYRLAEGMQINANYLSSQFKREMETGFVEYISILRVRLAQQLLKDMRYRTNEVASLVGFDNPKYFSRVFKKMTGILPSEYRSRIREYANIGNGAADQKECKEPDF